MSDDRIDGMNAISEGVRQAFVEVMKDLPWGGGLEPEDIKYAIREGVAEAFWRVATNATDAPCADFYDAIKDGVAQGMEQFDNEP